jgi:HEAT repeat protein
VEATLNRIASFITAKDSRLACAAAVVLTELAPRDAGLTKQLAAAVETADPVRRPFIIEALGRIGTAEAAAALVPLIKADGAASDQALRAIAHTGTAALKPLLKLVGSVPAPLLERIAECAARTGEGVAFSELLGHLKGADVEVCRAIRGGLRSAMTNSDDRFKNNLRKQLEKSFHDDELTKHHPSLIALMKIGGDLGDASLMRNMSTRVGKDYPAIVRRAAMHSIGLLHLTGDQRSKLVSQLLPMMLDPDVNNIAEPALEAIRQAHFHGEHQPALRKLLNSSVPRIREFAMQTLAALGSGRTMTDLITCLESPDRAIREEALGALSRAPSAATPLAQHLLDVSGGEAATEAARALVPQVAHVPKRMFDALADEFISLSPGEGKKQDADGVRASEEKRRAILSVFRPSASTALAERVLERASKLRGKDEPQRAHDLLKAIQGVTGWGDDHRIEMALAGLAYAPKDLARSVRVNDQHLRALEEVIISGRRQPKELGRTLLRDSSIGRKTLYYIGFHFVERMQNERQLGQFILEQMADGRGDEAKQAKEKLVIEGLVAVKGVKAGILEERARVMLAPSEIAATAVPRKPRAASAVSKKARPRKQDSKKHRGGSLRSRAAK